MGNDDLLALKMAECPQIRNGLDDVKQKIPQGTAWVDFVTVIVKSYFNTLMHDVCAFCEAAVLELSFLCLVLLS